MRVVGYIVVFVILLTGARELSYAALRCNIECGIFLGMLIPLIMLAIFAVEETNNGS